MNLFIEIDTLFVIHTKENGLPVAYPRLDMEQFFIKAFMIFDRVNAVNGFDKVYYDTIYSGYLKPIFGNISTILKKPIDFSNIFIKRSTTPDQIRENHRIMKARRYPNVNKCNFVYLSSDRKLCFLYSKNHLYIPEFVHNPKIEDRCLSIIAEEFNHIYYWFSKYKTVRTYPDFVNWVDKYITSTSSSSPSTPTTSSDGSNLRKSDLSCNDTVFDDGSRACVSTSRSISRSG